MLLTTLHYNDAHCIFTSLTVNKLQAFAVPPELAVSTALWRGVFGDAVPPADLNLTLCSAIWAELMIAIVDSGTGLPTSDKLTMIVHDRQLN